MCRSTRAPRDAPGPPGGARAVRHHRGIVRIEVDLGDVPHSSSVAMAMLNWLRVNSVDPRGSGVGRYEAMGMTNWTDSASSTAWSNRRREPRTRRVVPNAPPATKTRSASKRWTVPVERSRPGRTATRRPGRPRRPGGRRGSRCDPPPEPVEGLRRGVDQRVGHPVMHSPQRTHPVRRRQTARPTRTPERWRAASCARRPPAPCRSGGERGQRAAFPTNGTVGPVRPPPLRRDLVEDGR